MRRPNSTKDAIRSRIEELSKMENNDMRLKYLLLCASELASREVTEKGGIAAEHCAAFFMLRCLSMEQPSTQVASQAAWSLN